MSTTTVPVAVAPSVTNQPTQPPRADAGSGNRAILSSTTGSSIVQIRLSSLAPHPFNVRTHLSEKGTEELAVSIRNYGILQPLVIVPTLSPEVLRLQATEMGYTTTTTTTNTHKGNGAGAQTNPLPSTAATATTTNTNNKERLPDLAGEGIPTFWVVAGNRRLAAARLAGLKVVPCVVRTDLATLADQQALMLVENIQRENLNPLELAQTYHALRQTGLGTADIARQVGKTFQHVSDYLDLLKLPYPVLKEVGSRRIAYAAALAANNPALSDTNRQLIFADLISEGLTIKQVKARVVAMLEAQEQQDARLKAAQARLCQSQDNQSQDQHQGQGQGQAQAEIGEDNGSDSKSTTPFQTQMQPHRRIGGNAGTPRVSHSATARILAAKQEAASKNDPRSDVLQGLLAGSYHDDQNVSEQNSNDGSGQLVTTADVGTGAVAVTVEGRLLHYAFTSTCADCGMYKEEPALCAECPLLRCIRTVLTAAPLA